MEVPSWEQVELEAKQVLAVLESLQFDQTQVFTILFFSTLVIYSSLRFSPGSVAMWLIFALLSAVGLVISTWNLWIGFHLVTSVEQVIELLAVNAATRITTINLVLVVVLLILWILNESSKWQLSWGRTIAMWIMTPVAPTVSVPMHISHLSSLEAEYGPLPRHANRRLVNLYILVGLVGIVLVLPQWMQYLSFANAGKHFSAFSLPLHGFWFLASSNWASSISLRIMACILPPLSAWAALIAPIYFMPILFLFSIVSLPSFLAAALALKEIRNSHQQNRP